MLSSPLIRSSAFLRRTGSSFKVPCSSGAVEASFCTMKKTTSLGNSADSPGNKILVDRLESVDLEDDDRTTSSQKSAKGVKFEDHNSLAFNGKSTSEIVRALFVLKMCSVNFIVRNSLSMMNLTRRIFGGRALRILLKPVFYKQFVGGETPAEIQDCMRRLSEVGIRSMMAVTLEEETGQGRDEKIYESNTERILQILEISAAESTSCPMMQVKMTGLLSHNLLLTLGEMYCSAEDKQQLVNAVASMMDDEKFVAAPFLEALDKKQMSLFCAALVRLKRIGDDARSRSVKILVDAEYEHINKGLSLLTLAMVSTFNVDSPVIWNTYQCYLKNAYCNLQEELSLINGIKRCFGAKLVRGAYVTQERARSQELQIPDPVCEDYKTTNENYNKVLKFLLKYTKENWPKSAFIIASHNEESIEIATKMMKELGINNDNNGVCFGQLYGMGDLITYPLAVSGYAVYKSIPYGTVEEVLPYLARRALENTAMMKGTKKERHSLRKELRHRINSKIARPRFR